MFYLYLKWYYSIPTTCRMKIQKQNYSLPVVNHDITIGNNQFKKHGILFDGESKRALVIGPSNCGKTNTILSLIQHPNGLRFENLYIYSKSLYQPKYEYLRLLMKPIREIGYFEFTEGDSIISPEEIRPNSVMVFDDVASCNQDIIKKYFCFGRHKGTDCFYLCQTYSSIPKQLLRDNANLLIIFQQDMTNLRHIYDDHVSVDMSFSDFKNMCNLCWKSRHDFVVIDKDAPLSKGRYRKGFDNYIVL